MTRSYEELVGSLGRSVYFRPERKRVRDLLSRSANPRIEVAGREFPLFDISSTGASFLVPNGAPGFQPGTVAEVALRLRDVEVFRGPARVARVQPGPKSSLVGVALVKSFFDLPKFLWKDEEQELESLLQGKPLHTYDLVPERYRSIIAKTVNFIEHYRVGLTKHERRYAAMGGSGIQLLEKLTNDALDRLREPWINLEREASSAAEGCLEDPRKLDAAKRLTEVVVTPLLLDAPMIHRSYTKPLGYPGDFKVMNYYYENTPQGDSVIARVFHKFFIEHPLSNGVRTRKDFMIDLTRQENERTLAARDGRPLGVLSLGCGPAREVRDFVQSVGTWPGSINWTLIDQEDEALSQAFNDSHRAFAATPSSASVECLHLAFSQLLNDPSILPIGEYHFVYSVGLFDYLSEKRAQELILGLYERVAPAGLLAIGNAKGPNDYFWSPEFVLDWTLLYRTEEQMHRLTALLPRTASVELVLEPGDAYYFLLIRKS